jgi:hypothetical protein
MSAGRWSARRRVPTADRRPAHACRLASRRQDGSSCAGRPPRDLAVSRPRWRPRARPSPTAEPSRETPERAAHADRLAPADLGGGSDGRAGRAGMNAPELTARPTRTPSGPPMSPNDVGGQGGKIARLCDRARRWAVDTDGGNEHTGRSRRRSPGGPGPGPPFFLSMLLRDDRRPPDGRHRSDHA